jgi:GT2 family glycosyltransferase
MNDIEVAVVIVSYQSAELAIECLKSLHAERDAGNLRLRVVLVDNASGDLPQIAQAVERMGWSSWVTPVLAPKNGGFAYGNNLGIRHIYEQGRPDYIYLLNPDTQVRKGAIGALVGFLESHPEVGIAGSSFETEDGSDWPFAFRFPSMVSEIEHGMQTGIISRLLSRWTVVRTMDAAAEATDWVSGASMMIRPAVFAAVGCLDENFFLYYEETEFCHRALRAGFATWYVPQSRVMHMIGKSTHVDEETRFSRPMPGYWFDSRARYYAVTRGLGTAAAIDVAAILAGLWGLLKRKLLRRRGTPRYIRDLLAHSALLPKNRSVAPHKSYFPPT